MNVVQNILGTEYTIISQTEDENPKLDGADGLAELYSKKLIIDFTQADPKQAFENLDEYMKVVLRHEMIHAIFHESGLEKYVRDETLVQFIAMQYEKMEKLLNSKNVEDIIKMLRDSSKGE